MTGGFDSWRLVAFAGKHLSRYGFESEDASVTAVRSAGCFGRATVLWIHPLLHRRLSRLNEPCVLGSRPHDPAPSQRTRRLNRRSFIPPLRAGTLGRGGDVMSTFATYEIDGRDFSTLEESTPSSGHVLIPGASLGHSLDAFDDHPARRVRDTRRGFVLRWVELCDLSRAPRLSTDGR